MDAGQGADVHKCCELLPADCGRCDLLAGGECGTLLEPDLTNLLAGIAGMLAALAACEVDPCSHGFTSSMCQRYLQTTALFKQLLVCVTACKQADQCSMADLSQLRAGDFAVQAVTVRGLSPSLVAADGAPETIILSVNVDNPPCQGLF